MPGARARRAGPGDGRAGVGGDPAAARGRRLRGRAGRGGHASTSRRRGSSGSTAALEPALKRALAAVGSAWDAARRGGRAALRRARRGERRAAGAGADRLRRPHARVPRAAAAARCSRSSASRYEELEELGVRTIGQLAGLPGGAVAERLGPDGRRAWSLARGEQDGRVGAETAGGRRCIETLEFPEAVGNELTLRRGLAVLLDRLLARPERAGRPPRKVALWARLVGGASWRRTVTLREPTADPARLRAALGPKLAELPAPALKLRLEVVGARRAHRRAARARRRRGRGAAGPAPGRPAPGAGSRRRRRGLDGRGGGAVVAHPGSARTARSARRLNAPRPALVEAHADGTPRRVNRQDVARRPRGVARRRPLVDGGAGRTAATSTSCSRRARTPSSTATTTPAAWFTQRA